MKTFFLMFMLTFTILLLAGCSSTSASEIDAGSIADNIDVIYQTGPAIKAKELLMVAIRNHTEICMAFPYDFGVSMYTIVENKRISFQNQFRYLVDDENILVPFGTQKKMVDTLFVNALPDISNMNLKEPTEFILTIQGHICDQPEETFQKEIPFTIVP